MPVPAFLLAEVLLKQRVAASIVWVIPPQLSVTRGCTCRRKDRGLQRRLADVARRPFVEICGL